MINSEEELLAIIMDKIGSSFPDNAILKGGMSLRLTSSPRGTNDLDYVFIPFKSKKKIVNMILDALNEIPNVTTTHSLNSKCLRIIITSNNISTQIEANVMEDCETSIITTQLISQKYGIAPKIIKIMRWDIALAHKMAAWAERRLIRDIYDIHYIFYILKEKPNMEILKKRLKNLSMSKNIKNQKKKLTLNEYSDEIELFVNDLTQNDIDNELLGYLEKEHIAGINYIFKSTISDLTKWLNEQ